MDAALTQPRTASRRRAIRWSRVALYTFVIVSHTLLFFPVIWMTLSALKPMSEVLRLPPTFLPVQPTLANFAELLGRTSFPRYFWNSTIVATATTLVTMAIATMGAYSLTRFPLPGARGFATLTLFTYMFPPILLAVPLFVFITQLQLADTLGSLVVAHMTFALPFCLWLLWGFFRTVPLALEEAAMIDGCTRLGALVRVVLPLSLPGIISVGVFAFLMSWNDYLFGLIFISTDSQKTLAVGVSYFIGPMAVEWGLINAAAVVVSAPVLLVFMVIQRYLIQGFGAGALKE